MKKDASEIEKLFLQSFRVKHALCNALQPFIAMVRSVAYAAGYQLVAACDLSIAAESARFAIPGVKIRLSCFTPIALVSRNICRKIFELAFLGEPISPEEALRIGLVNKVVRDEILETETEEDARRIMSFPLEVLEAGKRFLYSQIFMENIAAPKFVTEAIALDRQNGMIK